MGVDETKSTALQLKPGDLLSGRYEVQEVVGVGGMGYVYRARDTNFKAIRLVAVKEMIAQVTDPLVRNNIAQIFEREANILATLRHPAIPRIYDYFTQGERSYLVMELVNGRDLDQLISETKEFFTEAQVMGWAIELCDVLSYIHSYEPEPIVFRDMKPSNVMINNQGHIILVDFGIAKVFQSGKKNTMIGTQGYSPPDQYRGEATPKVDIYALGATMHHLLTLRDPRLEAPFSFGERPIREINPEISEATIAVIDRALQYDPDDRFADAEEMKQALMAAAQKTGKLDITTVLTSSVVTSTKGLKPLWTFEVEDEIRGTPLIHDGKVYIGSYDNNLYALNAATGEFDWKYATEGGIPGRPAFYDNNIFVGSEDNRLYAISTRSGKMSWSHFTDGPVRSSPRIAEGHVFIGSDDGFLHAVNLTNGRLSWRAEAGTPVRSTPYVTDEFVYFGAEDGLFHCVSFRGDVKWTHKAKRAITSSPVVGGDAVYFGSMDGTIYAMDANTGWAIWRFRLGKGSISSPCLVDDYLYTGSTDNYIYCIDTRSSREVWRYETDHQVTSSPVIYKDAIYCGSVDGNLYCLEAKKGGLRWKFPTQGAVTGTPVIYDDVVYFGSTDKNVYALLA
ncbi:MAG: protein kinase [Chloroflexi bacterium]|nr:MAG: protein kinase [Chloroflexota bacterium]MBL1196351.1 protein kinase [Chloroflexota bacterium]NOH13646.1 serine/threonine-protein kinase [Chloroflexota bacterium]